MLVTVFLSRFAVGAFCLVPPSLFVFRGLLSLVSLILASSIQASVFRSIILPSLSFPSSPVLIFRLLLFSCAQLRFTLAEYAESFLHLPLVFGVFPVLFFLFISASPPRVLFQSSLALISPRPAAILFLSPP